MQYTSRAAQLYRQLLERDVAKGIAAAKEVKEVEGQVAQQIAATPAIASAVAPTLNVPAPAGDAPQEGAAISNGALAHAVATGGQAASLGAASETSSPPASPTAAGAAGVRSVDKACHAQLLQVPKDCHLLDRCGGALSHAWQKFALGPASD